MDAKVRQYTEAKVRELIRAYSCCAEAKAAGQAWLDAVGTDQRRYFHAPGRADLRHAHGGAV